MLNAPVLMGAVPKRRVTWRKARLRMQNKWLKPITHIGTCPACGQPKLAHHLCLSCVKKMTTEVKHVRKTILGIKSDD
jgi:ribosomal protein L32